MSGGVLFDPEVVLIAFDHHLIVARVSLMRGSCCGCPLSLRVVDEGFRHGVIIEGHKA